MHSVDSVVVGGGIAGLLTALRLARAGQEVTLLEGDRLGSGATVANHGIVHSGALFVRRHVEIVPFCREAQPAFTSLVGAAEVSAEPALYAIPASEADVFAAALADGGIPVGEPDPDAAADVAVGLRAGHVLMGVPERVFSSRGIVALLAGQCLAAGVEIHVGTTVAAVDHEYGKVTGAVLASGERIAARNVVLGAGAGSQALLAGVAATQASLIAARLDTMLHFPGARITRGLVQPTLGHPVVMPTIGGGALSSFHGATQPPIRGHRAYAVPIGKADALLSATRAAYAPGRLDEVDVVAYVAGKVDYIGAASTEFGRVNPAFHVIDHEETDGLRGLYTVVTGKMTLAFHASRMAAQAVLGTGLDLSIAPVEAPPVAEELVAVEPWAAPGVG